MQVRCIHCHTPIGLDDQETLASVNCRSCGGSFSLADDETRPIKSRPADDARPAGRMVAHFELIDQLGRGGYGAVWMARDTRLDRVVAVKIPRYGDLDADETEQFLREARAAAQLHHPNIVGVHEIGRDGETVYIVSDYIRGARLTDLLLQGRLSARETVELVAKVADGLYHAHEAGVIHRDLKPSNIMVSAPPKATATDGGSLVPYLMDFGLARRESGEVTMTVDGQVLGTPAFMSPEQARGESHQADRRSDIYSLGVILYLMLTGEMPFRGNPSMLVHQILNDEPAALRRLDNYVPRDLETICLKCLHKNPDRRYQSAADLAADLRRWLGHEPIHARPVGRLERLHRWCRRKPWAAAALVILGVSIIVLGGLALSLDWALQETRKAELATQQAHQRATMEQRRSALHEAQALRLSTKPGRRFEALAALEKAAAIEPGLDLRDEYVRCLDLPDVRAAGRSFSIPNWDNGFAALRGENQIVSLSPKGHLNQWNVQTGRSTSELDRLGEMSPPAAVSPDGVLFAAALADGGGAAVWNLQTGQFVAELTVPPGAPTVPTALAFSAPASRIAVAYRTENWSRWSVLTYEVPSLEVSGTWDVEAQHIDCLCFAARGDVLAASIRAGDAHLIGLWRWHDRKELQRLSPASRSQITQWDLGRDRPSRLDVSRDGRLLVAASQDGNVRMWQIGSAGGANHPDQVEEILSVTAHQGAAFAAQLSPDQHWLATTGEDRWLNVWDAHSAQLLTRVHLDKPASILQWSSSGTRIVCCDWDASVRLWKFVPPFSRVVRLRGGSPPKGSRWAGEVVALRFSPQEHRLACVTRGPAAWHLVELLRSEIKVESLEVEEDAAAVAFSPDGVSLASAARGAYLVRKLDATYSPEIHRYANWRLLALAFNAQGEPVAVGLDNETQLTARNLRTNEQLLRLDAKHLFVSFGRPGRGESRLTAQRVRLSPDGRYLALLDDPGGDMSLRVFDFPAGRERFSQPLKEYTESIAIADRTGVIAVGQRQTIAVFNPHEGRRLYTLAGHESQVTGLAFSGDGLLLASVSRDDGIVKLWDARAGELLATFHTGEDPITRIDLSRTGRWLAAADRSGLIRVWDVAEVRKRLTRAGLDWSDR